MMNKFDEGLLRITTSMWEQHQYAKVEYNRMLDLLKKKPNQTSTNENIMLTVKAIYDSTKELYEILDKLVKS